MNKQEAALINQRLRATVEGLMRDIDPNLQVAKQTMRYEGDEAGGFTVRITVTKKVVDEVTGVDLGSPEAKAYLAHCRWLTHDDGRPFTPDCLGTNYSHGGVIWRFDGYRPRAKKMPFVITNTETGQRYKVDKNHPVIRSMA